MTDDDGAKATDSLLLKAHRAPAARITGKRVAVAGEGLTFTSASTDDNGIASRLKSEGASSPGDVVLMVDAARLWRAEIDGLFQPVKSALLERRIPATLRGKDDGQRTSLQNEGLHIHILLISGGGSEYDTLQE